jgi:hypothetical protein
MKYLIFRSWLLLFYLDFFMRCRGFGALHRLVRERKVRHDSAEDRVEKDFLCRAVDLSCVFYFKKVMCLQRSATTVILLRRHGWEAEMVIGTQLFPFRSHAWVESEGRIVNDKPYMHDIYQVLDRC